MKFLLDTDTCSYIIKNVAQVRRKLEKHPVSDLAISAITWAELNSWVMASSKPEQRIISLQKMFAPIRILSFTAEDATYHGLIRKRLQNEGQLIGALDLLIAAQALSRNLTVVSNNIDHFGRIEQLKTENWF